MRDGRHLLVHRREDAVVHHLGSPRVPTGSQAEGGRRTPMGCFRCQARSWTHFGQWVKLFLGDFPISTMNPNLIDTLEGKLHVEVHFKKHGENWPMKSELGSASSPEGLGNMGCAIECIVSNSFAIGRTFALAQRCQPYVEYRGCLRDLSGSRHESSKGTPFGFTLTGPK